MFLKIGSEQKVAANKWQKNTYWLLVVVLVVMGVVQAMEQYRESSYIKSVALRAVKEAGATDERSRVIALRDFLRAKVTYQGAPYDRRPFLRATAAETIQSGYGYCGEVTRAFICLAEAVGIRAQRINLVGKHLHVVAEAELETGESFIVDGQNPPSIKDLEPLDRVILRPEYDDYYTLNLRRLHLQGIISRIKMKIGPLTYWTENPHALQATLWISLALALVCACGVRSLLRLSLRKRGWIHISNEKQVQAAAAALKDQKRVYVKVA